MICPTCNGAKYLIFQSRPDFYVDMEGRFHYRPLPPSYVPCRDCSGSGFAYCCDRLKGQPNNGTEN